MLVFLWAARHRPPGRIRLGRTVETESSFRLIASDGGTILADIPLALP
jgi:hypothetical protein